MSIANTHRDYAASWWTPTEWMRWVHETLSNAVGFELGTIFDPWPRRWNPDAWDAMRDDWPDVPTYDNHAGSRGSAQRTWARAVEQGVLTRPYIRVLFSREHPRHMRPFIGEIGGWLIEPVERIKWLWGGATGNGRVHGQPVNSPTQWSCFWSTVQPATPPVECLVTRTGAAWRMGNERSKIQCR